MSTQFWRRRVISQFWKSSQRIPGPHYARAVENLAPFGECVKLYNQAVWRSEGVQFPLTLARIDSNLGGASLLWGSGEGLVSRQPVDVIALDDLISDVTGQGRRRIKLLKVDCEAAEFPILLTSRRLELVDHIVGEFHELSGQHDSIAIPEHSKVPGFSRFTIDELAGAPQQAGLSVTHFRHGESSLGLFYATRSRSTQPAVN